MVKKRWEKNGGKKGKEDPLTSALCRVFSQNIVQRRSFAVYFSLAHGK
jgi:hypothetical protein